MTGPLKGPLTAEQQELVIEWYYLVPYTMKLYRSMVTTIGADEAESLGRYALVWAALHFDPAHGTVFSSYAVPTIWAHWWKHLDRYLNVIAYKSGTRKSARHPRPEVCSLFLRVGSASHYTKDVTLADLLPIPEEVPTLDFDERDLLRKWVDLLPVTWVHALVRTTVDEIPLRQVGQEVGLSAERVRQLRAKAVAWLQAHMTWDGHELHLAARKEQAW